MQADVRWGRGRHRWKLEGFYYTLRFYVFEAGLNVYHPQNLEGRRQIMSFEQGKRHAEFYVKLGCVVLKEFVMSLDKNLTFEEALSQLEDLVSALEQGKNLEEAVETYERVLR